jgi:hypothetical protein
LIKAGDYGSLSDLLDLPEADVKELSSITSLNIRREPLVEDLSVEKIPFYIVVKVEDPTVLPKLQASMVEYLNGTEFIQERMAYMLEKSKEELKFLEHRLTIVDSLSQRLIIKDADFNDKEVVTRMELLEETLTVYTKLQAVKGNIAFNKNMEILDGFIPSGRKDGKGLSHWLLYGFVAGIGLRFLALIFK